MKLWIDDLRPAPDDTWEVATNSFDAISILEWPEVGTTALLEEVSFDHDLGGDDTTRPVMLWMAEQNLWPKRIFIHTANPVGRDWLLGTATRYAPTGTEIKS